MTHLTVPRATSKSQSGRRGVPNGDELPTSAELRQYWSIDWQAGSVLVNLAGCLHVSIAFPFCWNFPCSRLAVRARRWEPEETRTSPRG